MHLANLTFRSSRTSKKPGLPIKHTTAQLFVMPTIVNFEYENFEACEKTLDTVKMEDRICQIAENNVVDDGAWGCTATQVVRKWCDDGVKHDFVWMVLHAFKEHYGLTLKPQDFHLLILAA